MTASNRQQDANTSLDLATTTRLSHACKPMSMTPRGTVSPCRDPMAFLLAGGCVKRAPFAAIAESGTWSCANAKT